MRTTFTGVGTALITPFTTTGAVDEAAVRRLARRQIDLGTHFLVPCGTTGEVPTLSADERRRVVEIVVDEAAGKTPVLAGAGGYDTREIAHAAVAMQQAGANGLLSVTPVLQPAHARRALRPLRGHRRGHAAADHRLQRARPHRLQRRRPHAGEARHDSHHHRREGSLGQHVADGRHRARRARRLPGALGRRRARAAAHGDWRPRHHLGVLQPDPARDGRHGARPPNAATSPPPARCISACSA